MGDYVDVAGVRTWYETAGEGDPLVLLHGGLATNAHWGDLISALGDHYHVLAPERRGHGHTPDVAGPLSYEAMAVDTIGFIDAVVAGPAHLVGWSDGAIVAMLVALQRPDLSRKLVLFGGEADVSALVPEFERVTAAPPDTPLLDPFREAYAAVSPDGPDHWPVMFEKAVNLWRTEPHIPLADLGAIQPRTLVIVGDDDVVTLEHAVAMYRAIPDAELAVLPGTSHLAHLEKPALFRQLVVDFLQSDSATTLLPIRRAAAPVPA